MNKTRLKSINGLHDRLQTIQEELCELLADEEEALNNIPECFESRIERAQEAISAMEDAESLLTDVINALESIE